MFAGPLPLPFNIPVTVSRPRPGAVFCYAERNSQCRSV